MKIAHWTMVNSSGMYRVAESFAQTECMLGHESWLVDFSDEKGWGEVLDADVHVVHTHLPDKARMQMKKPPKTVFFCHGTPEYVFTGSVINGSTGVYGFSDTWQLIQWYMQHSDAIVTHVPRHHKIWQSLCDKRTIVDLVPMGLDKGFWKSIPSMGHYMGEPAVFTAENSDYSKWPYDLFILWSWIYEALPLAHLHAVYLPTDQHRWWYPLMNRNGCGYKCHSSGAIFTPDQLRNAFVSTDFYIGLVRYGDFNRMSLEANACGAKTISYRGNPFSDYWVTEGDQRVIAKELIDIFKGKTKPRKKDEPGDIFDTSKTMIKIYERIA